MLVSQHVEKKLKSLASSLEVPILKRSKLFLKGGQDMEELFEDCHDVEVVYQRCCGLDVHKKMIVACLIILAADGKRRKPLPEDLDQSVALRMGLNLGTYPFVRAGLFVWIGLIMIARLPTEHRCLRQWDQVLPWDLRCLDAQTCRRPNDAKAAP